LTRTRVVDPHRSRCANAAFTATSWASNSPGSPVSAHHTDSDFGAENVASNPATARTTFPFANVRSTRRLPSGVPAIGSRTSNNASNWSAATLPERPTLAAWAPVHTPGAHTRCLARRVGQVVRVAVAAAEDAYSVVTRNI